MNARTAFLASLALFATGGLAQNSSKPNATELELQKHIPLNTYRPRFVDGKCQKGVYYCIGDIPREHWPSYLWQGGYAKPDFPKESLVWLCAEKDKTTEFYPMPIAQCNNRVNEMLGRDDINNATCASVPPHGKGFHCMFDGQHIKYKNDGARMAPYQSAAVAAGALLLGFFVVG